MRLWVENMFEATGPIKLADAGFAGCRKVVEDLVADFPTPEEEEEARGEAEKYIKVTSPVDTVMLCTHL